jgi:hypothetical protein
MQRRNFLTTAAVAAAGLLLPVKALLSSPRRLTLCIGMSDTKSANGHLYPKEVWEAEKGREINLYLSAPEDGERKMHHDLAGMGSIQHITGDDHVLAEFKLLDNGYGRKAGQMLANPKYDVVTSGVGKLEGGRVVEFKLGDFYVTDDSAWSRHRRLGTLGN